MDEGRPVGPDVAVTMGVFLIIVFWFAAQINLLYLGQYAWFAIGLIGPLCIAGGMWNRGK